LTVHHGVEILSFSIALQFNMQIWRNQREPKQKPGESLLFQALRPSLFAMKALLALEPGLLTARSL
jgi:hypothetical protein